MALTTLFAGVAGVGQVVADKYISKEDAMLVMEGIVEENNACAYMNGDFHEFVSEKGEIKTWERCPDIGQREANYQRQFKEKGINPTVDF